MVEDPTDGGVWCIVRFADEVDDGEPARYFRARQEGGGRWYVDGLDRWRYDTAELIFLDQLPVGVVRDPDCVMWITA